MTPPPQDNSRPLSKPNIRAIDPWTIENPQGRLHQLLSDDERARLAAIASVVRFKKGQTIYTKGEASGVMFNIISGIVASYQTDAHGHDHIAAFLYPNDLFGLAEEGRYTNSAKAIIPVTAYALSTTGLRRLFIKDADLDFHFIVKLSQDLRHSQRHVFLLSQKQALSRLALFLEMQEHIQTSRGEPTAEIYLPMNRSDIAEYVGLTLAAVSRGFGSLIKRGIISVRDRHHVKVIDRIAFDQLADLPRK